MPSLPGINHQRAIKAFEKAGFQIVRQGKHITMTDGEYILTIRGSRKGNNSLNIDYNNS
ncbi:type II toxin-antitoxin system HicA family toxin [Crocosphaera sp. XPORK-15E]|uniref:type II toxin-antitoxin system HicA family toxin n=1 Tax=Crocosphaera sp. XPORK-15E TaxID=3110247 RepID=UPI002B21BA22|nr:type II toxin-antitoxin system HicA family toxin [Crocosphaera sp. XPORK-15E]MEA5534497.1 type II toxin-antitoxin system HicA family toxin [Crocosphaera sp. XPORK-15E]